MRVRITVSSEITLTFSTREHVCVEDDLVKAGFIVNRVFVNVDEYELYTEINSLGELNKLVKSFNTPIVYSLSNNVIFIEKYDSNRE